MNLILSREEVEVRKSYKFKGDPLSYILSRRLA